MQNILHKFARMHVQCAYIIAEEVFVWKYLGQEVIERDIACANSPVPTFRM